jgi:hypothetical protein
MSAALARRDDGCASDLLMDRWLLGEIPGSDEARRLEQHVRTCAACEARLLALRSLYGARPAPRPTQVERPRLVTVPQDGLVAQSGVLQVVILRDGLLVGTEVFTPGRYEIGADASCALKLEGIEGSHAVLHLRGGRVAIEAKHGPVFVNGYRVECCELRPIDEACVGSYVLRTRVIEREGEVAPSDAPTALNPVPAPAPGAAPSPAALALKLELYWGDALQAAAVFDKVPSPGDLERWGFMGAEAIEGGFELDGRYPVRNGDSVRIPRGPLTIVASAVPVQPKVGRTSVREWPWFVISLASMLAISVVLFGWLSPVPDPEQPFVPKEFKAVAKFIPEPKEIKTPPTPSTTKREPPTRHTPHARPTPTQADPVPFNAKSLTQSVGKVLSSLDNVGRTGAKGGKKVAGLGALPGLGLPVAGTAFKFGADTTGAIGIGASGTMRKGNIGLGSPLGRVTSSSGVPHYSDKDIGRIDRDAVAKVVAAHTSEISACYERSMIKSGAFAGKMLVEWTIDEAGRVHSSRIKSTDVKNADFGTCVLAHLDQWKFPPAHGGRVVVSYPFHLNSVGY